MSNIEKKYELKTGEAIALIVIFLLNVLWFVCNLLTFSGDISIQFLISTFMFADAAFYTYYGYKKPHGNNMRYLLLLQAISIAVLVVVNGTTQPAFLTVNYLTSIILVAYMAGRLEHYKQNIVISVIVLISKLISTFYYIDVWSKAGTLTFTNAVSCFGSTLIWLLIVSGYIIRFKLHKEAGLEDK